MAGYNYTTNGGANIRHYVGKSTYRLPSVDVPEGADLFQYDTDAVLYFDSEVGGWYDQTTGTWYKPGTEMEPLS